MKSSTRPWLLVTLGGVFFVLDRLLKWLSLNFWTQPRLPLPFLGWQPFVNPGVAFGIPLPLWSAIATSAAIIALIVFSAFREFRRRRILLFSGWAILLFGALSNFIDRLVYNSVIDYLLAGWSLINLADVMIVVGLGIVIVKTRKNKQ